MLALKVVDIAVDLEDGVIGDIVLLEKTCVVLSDQKPVLLPILLYHLGQHMIRRRPLGRQLSPQQLNLAPIEPPEPIRVPKTSPRRPLLVHLADVLEIIHIQQLLLGPGVLQSVVFEPVLHDGLQIGVVQ